MNAGDIVQVQQQTGAWVYAQVINAGADGSAFVQIRHPANIDHEKMQFFPKDRVRTSETLKAQLEDRNLPKDKRGPLLVQLEYLT
jgi:hypothetical protein